MSFRSPFVLFLYMVQVSFKFTTFFIIALFPVLPTSCCFTDMLRIHFSSFQNANAGSYVNFASF